MTENEIKEICEKYNIENWTLNEETGLVDVDDSVYLNHTHSSKLPLNFGDVSGDFLCHFNKLTTLKGTPISVGGYFFCYENNLTTRNKLPNAGLKMYCDKNTKWIF